MKGTRAKEDNNLKQESFTRRAPSICWYLCKLCARGERTMATWPLLAACVSNALSMTQFNKNCLVLEDKKGLNYTHPVINFAAEFV